MITELKTKLHNLEQTISQKKGQMSLLNDQISVANNNLLNNEVAPPVENVRLGMYKVVKLSSATLSLDNAESIESGMRARNCSKCLFLFFKKSCISALTDNSIIGSEPNKGLSVILQLCGEWGIISVKPFSFLYTIVPMNLPRTR